VRGGYDSRSAALGIDDAGNVVGHGEVSDPSVPKHGFLFANDLVTDLNGYIDPTSGRIVAASIKINDRDQIIALGRTNTVYNEIPRPDLALLLSPFGHSNVGPGEECARANCRRAQPTCSACAADADSVAIVRRMAGASISSGMPGSCS
jgi:hypothetical protein